MRCERLHTNCAVRTLRVTLNAVFVANKRGLPRLPSCWKILASCPLSRDFPLIQEDNYGTSVCLDVQTWGIRLPPTPNYCNLVFAQCGLSCAVPSAWISARSFPTSNVYSLFYVYKGHYTYTHQPLLFLARWEMVGVFVWASECVEMAPDSAGADEGELTRQLLQEFYEGEKRR